MTSPSPPPFISRQEIRRAGPWALLVVAMVVAGLFLPAAIEYQEEYALAQKSADVQVLTGTRAPDVRLVTTAGRPFRLASLRGRAVIVAFVATRGSSVDELVAREAHLALAHSGSLESKAAFVFVSVEPGGESRLASFLKGQGLGGTDVIGLTGPAPLLGQALQQFGIYVKRDKPSVHTEVLYVIDPDGRERYLMHPSASPTITMGYAWLFLHDLDLARHAS